MAVCEWPLIYPCETPVENGMTGCSAIDSLSEERRALVEQMAIDTLFQWSGRVFGTCEAVLRPCTWECADSQNWTSTFWGRGPYPWMGVGSGTWIPQLIGGEWFNVGCGCLGSCSCDLRGPSSLMLPGPVQEVLKVMIDGEVLPSESYKVMYRRVLVRTDGENWPACQNLLADASQMNTFEVTYTKGIPVPPGGQFAAGTLACELAKALCNDSSCQLPKRLQTLSREGVTIGFQDQFESLDKNRTGIWTIDSWLASVTVPRPSVSVRSVDIPKVRH